MCPVISYIMYSYILSYHTLCVIFLHIFDVHLVVIEEMDLE